MVEAVAGVREGPGGLLFAEAEDHQPVFADACGQAGEVAVAAHQAEAVEAPGVEQVHGVEDGREGVEADVVGVDEYGEGLEFVLHPVMTQFFLCGGYGLDGATGGGGWNRDAMHSGRVGKCHAGEWRRD